jgi:hypothetical protein
MIPRAALGIGWLLLLASLAAIFAGQGQLSRSLDRIVDHAEGKSTVTDVVTSGTAGVAAPWLIVAALAVVAIGILLI